MLCNSRFNSFVISNINNSDYMFVDTPWNYRPSQYSSAEFWKGVTFADLFLHLNCSTIFMWVTTELIPTMLSGHTESSFELKALVPYARVARHEDVTYAMNHGFRNPFLHLAVFQRRDATITTMLSKVIIIEHDNELQRPVMWEDSMFMQLSSEGFKGLYILPDGGIADTDISDRQQGGQMIKKELF